MAEGLHPIDGRVNEEELYVYGARETAAELLIATRYNSYTCEKRAPAHSFLRLSCARAKTADLCTKETFFGRVSYMKEGCCAVGLAS